MGHPPAALYLAQYQDSGSKGGVILSFTDGTNSNWAVTDKEGYFLNDDQSQNTTHFRTINLSNLAGKIINELHVVQESDTPAGAWNVYFDYISLVSADATVHPIYTAQTSSPLSLGSHTSGETGLGSTIDINRDKEIYPTDTTTYYGTDHLGSARLVSEANGYPVWSGVFLPFGQEWSPQITTNHYKFTGKERDAESSLDYFGARYYSSTMGRWMSPDPGWFFAANIHNPQSWNLYGYVANNPLANIDPDGYDCVYLNDAGTDIERDRNGNPIGIDTNSSKGECMGDATHEGTGGYWVDGSVSHVGLFTNSDDVSLTGFVAHADGTTSYYDAYYTNATGRLSGLVEALGYRGTGTVDLYQLLKNRQLGSTDQIGPQNPGKVGLGCLMDGAGSLALDLSPFGLVPDLAESAAKMSLRPAFNTGDRLHDVGNVVEAAGMGSELLEGSLPVLRSVAKRLGPVGATLSVLKAGRDYYNCAP